MTPRLPLPFRLVLSAPVLLPLMVTGCGAREPEYQGKPATVWVAALQDANPKVQAVARDWVGSESLKEPKIMSALVLGLKQGNYAAAELMGEIAHDAPPALIPEMVQALGETARDRGSNISVRLAAARALPKFGAAAGPALPALVDMLRDDTNYTIREVAAENIGKLPPNLAQQATQPLLVAAKTDSVPAVQFKAAEVLRVVNPEALKQAGGN